ncbi:hypothetical protein [Rhodococcus sp. NPDC056516]|uniref:hypothetical protein n=1 Tax=Rhodococcus sp. NPDC056516 TaxID=3345847 RepID=UPI00366AC901
MATIVVGGGRALSGGAPTSLFGGMRSQTGSSDLRSLGFKQKERRAAVPDKTD